MNNLKIFENAEFGQVRTTIVDNKPFVCLKDVCEVLEIKNISDCKNRLNKDGVVTTEVIDSLGRKQQANFINESNLYKVIFQSRKENAEKFTEWVTSEVLPSIRKHGAYMTDDTLEKALTSPDFLIQLATNLKEEKEKRAKLEEEKKANAPKVLFADAVATSKTSILVGELAKILKQNGVDTGQKKLFEWLREQGYLMKSGSSRNMPTQKSMNLGLFEIKETVVTHADGHTTVNKTTKVTGKGQQYFINKLLVA